LDVAKLTSGCVEELKGVVLDAFSKLDGVVVHLVALFGKAACYLGCVVSAFEL